MASTWLLVDEGRGLYSVEHDRHTMLSDVGEDYALDYIRRVWNDGEKVYVVEADGYRVDITRTFRRRRRTR